MIYYINNKHLNDTEFRSFPRTNYNYLLQQQCIEKNKFSILFQSSNIFVSIKKILLYIFMTFLYQLNEM